ncbi:DNA alkylation repair protein [Nocardioides malaquae]|uniref:DNA alkylation repair protein n=1 Tax=Nocardioides malaquae TaxID=2773426 RepID=UPI0029D4104C|nr:DNA alkylation repair protein [Nocardioides malaquae]
MPPTATPAPTPDDVRRAVAAHADPVDAENLARFFQTHPGGYGEGDAFLGVRVPALRAVAKAYVDLPPADIRELLDDPWHEHRMVALLIAVTAFRRAGRVRTADPELRQALHATYLEAVLAGRVDNWDLVDCSAEWLVGEHLRTTSRDTALVERLTAETDLWRRRVGIMATFAWTKAGDPAPALTAAAAVLDDRRDLVQKAAGWMLREVGKRVDRQVLLDFLEAHAAEMGRTALSYATEHLAPEVRARLRAL